MNLSMGLVKQLTRNPEIWDTLVINKRKPHTKRLFTRVKDTRVCLHIFSPCGEDEAFGHPHAWPMSCHILRGGYYMKLGINNDLCGQIYLPQGSSYKMENPELWHKVWGHEETWTVMFNGLPYDNPRDEVVTTKGKDLDTLDENEKVDLLNKFASLLY